jgi:biopolymer transport protein ExbB
METKVKSATDAKVRTANPLRDYFAALMMLLCIGVGVFLYVVIMGDPNNFEGKDTSKHPLPGNIMGLMYKGGFLVPLALGLLLMVVTFSIERIITLGRASGKGSMDVFVQRIQIDLENNNMNAALAKCDEQKGTVGNVVKAALLKYKEMSEEAKTKGGDHNDKEQRIIAIQKALEEATALELPMLQKHLIIIATIVSIATLIGLIGTVLGMIKAFAALATSGAPDAVALATGISEALINTAIGISTSTIATVVYNYFTARIDEMTYRIDEAGFSIVQTYAEKH